MGAFQLQPEITFSELAEKWAEVHVTKVRPATWNGYATQLRRHILPCFADENLQNITNESVEHFMSHLMIGGLAPQTVTKCLRLLKLIIKQGVIWGYLYRSPCEYTKPPKTQSTREIRFLKPRELHLLINAAQPEHRALITVACLTGMRRGEILAISWEDVDLSKNRLFVRRAVSAGVISEPKSRYSKRFIDIPASLSEILKEHMVNQAKELAQNSQNLVFPNKNGKLMEHSSLFRHIFLPTLGRAGLPRVRFHDLRHSFASMLIDRGENIKYVQRVLGHSGVQITLDVYGHLMPDVGKEAAARSEEFFFSEK